MGSNDGHLFKLGWKDHAANFSITLSDLLEQNELVDVTLVADGHMFSAHRLILSAISPQFRQMFNQVSANQQAFVILNGISARMLKYLLDYIYRGEVIIKQTDFEAFLRTAKDLRIKGLHDDDDENEEHPHERESRPSVPAPTPTPAPLNDIDLCQSASKNSAAQYQSTQTNGHQNTAERNEKKRPFVYRSNDVQEYTNMVDENTFEPVTDNNDDNSFVVELTDPLGENRSIERPRQKRARRNYREKSIDEVHKDERRVINDVPNTKLVSVELTKFIEADIREINGRKQLFHNNYKFGLRRVGPVSTLWRCTKHNSRRCTACVNTINVNGSAMIKDENISHTHAHDPMEIYD